MQPNEPTSRALAQRLQTLRKSHWHDLTITQLQLAKAFGGVKPLSASLISSWESQQKPVKPPSDRLRSYATFFATRRSLKGGHPRLLTDAELTDEERGERDRLHEELLALSSGERESSGAAAELIPAAGAWHFADQVPVSVICSRLPTELLEKMPYTDPADPDYIRSYSYADLDSIIDLHGQIRAANPATQVNIRVGDDLGEDDYAAHLVVLGGVDWNPVARDLLIRLEKRLNLPIRQSKRTGPSIDEGRFEVKREAGNLEFRPVLEMQDDKAVLREDVAMLFRGPSPYKAQRTVTMCNGMYGRGTYAAVRALTDPLFRDRNEAYLRERFAGRSAFAILTRVLVVNREALTPDWTVEDNRLYEWPET